MTENDILKFCEKGSHEYSEGELVRTIGPEEFANVYEIFKCKLCPSRWVKCR